MDEVKDSGLRGRGGAGFPTGLKWSFVPMGSDAPRPKYLVCQRRRDGAGHLQGPAADGRRSAPADRRHDHRGATRSRRTSPTSSCAANTSCRQERLAAGDRRSLRASTISARNILGSGYSLEMYLHISAGRYICGEETALLNALEGKRANPRAKPPFPQVSGLWGKPTIVNNVETLCNVPHIVEQRRGLVPER